MKTFNYYKNLIEDDCANLREHAFEIIEFFDLKSYDTATESIHRNKSWVEVKSITESDFLLSLTYKNEKYSLSYTFERDEVIVFPSDDISIQISFYAKKQLLNYMFSKQGKIDFKNKPFIIANELKEELVEYFHEQYDEFNHVVIYDPKIDIDDDIIVNAIFFSYELNIGIDLFGKINNEKLDIINFHLFNISKIDRNKIEINTERLTWQDNVKINHNIKYFYEHVLINYMEDTMIKDVVKNTGFKALKNNDLREMIELRISFWYNGSFK